MQSTNAALQRTAPRANSTRHWLLALTSMLCVLALTSCGVSTPPRPAPPQIPAELIALLKPIPPIDSRLTTPCPALPLATDDRATTLIRLQQRTAALSHACAEQLLGLAAAARARERIEAERIDRAARAMEPITLRRED
jgi:hypothetical protein